MRYPITRRASWLLMAGALAWTSAARAGDPADPPPTDSPRAATAPDAAALRGAVEKYLQAEEAGGKHLILRDLDTRLDLVLSLVRVDDDPVRRIAPERYVASTQMKTPDGDPYGIDFALKAVEGVLEVQEIWIRQTAEGPRYTWELNPAGMWRKTPVPSGTEDAAD